MANTATNPSAQNASLHITNALNEIQRMRNHFTLTTNELINAADGLRGIGDLLSLATDDDGNATQLSEQNIARLGSAVAFIGNAIGDFAERLDGVMTSSPHCVESHLLKAADALNTEGRDHE